MSRLPAYLADRHLSFDDGTFASSVLLMRQGAAPFREVFSSQAPLFLPLAWLGDLLGGRTLNSPRTLGVVSAVLLALAVWSAARQLGGRRAAFVAAVLATTAGSVLRVTGPLAADGPALAFGTGAVAVALRSCRSAGSGRIRGAVLSGLLLGASLATKTIEVPMAIPVLLVFTWPAFRALRAPSPDRLSWWRYATEPLLVCLTVLVVYVAAALPWSPAKVWDQAVRYRADAAVDRDPAGNLAKLVSTSITRDTSLWVFAALGSVAALVARRSPHTRRRTELPTEAASTPAVEEAPSPGILLGAWLAAAVAWLVFVVSPLFRPHVSGVVPPLAIAISLIPVTRRGLALAALAASPFIWLQNRELIVDTSYSGAEAQLVSELRRLPEGALGLSDEPGLLWRAGLRTTGDLVDPSVLRIRQGRITEKSVVEQAALPRVCAVVVWSSDRFGSFENLPALLRQEGFRLRRRWGAHRVLYTRPVCSP
ncbi:MAG: hypothetical protein KatS3mg008_0331 [Acidimicrobiales bacterium]|nr:MAG: hypothetical protein KatS3mg008_0331 [Acidimicrobiales bacterium]